MKILYVDVETSGLDSSRHGITQLAGCVEVDGVVKESFNFKPRLFPGDLMAKEALEKTGLTEQALRDRTLTPEDCYAQFCAILNRHCDKYERADKFFLVAYNGYFDDDFLRSFFRKNKDEFYGSWFWWPVLDLAVLTAWAYAKVRPRFRNFQLATVCETLGVKAPGEAHEAAHDVALVRALYGRLQERISQEIVRIV